MAHNPSDTCQPSHRHRNAVFLHWALFLNGEESHFISHQLNYPWMLYVQINTRKHSHRVTLTLLPLHTINHTEQPSQLSKNAQNCQFKDWNPLRFPNVGASGWYVTIVTLHMGHPPLHSSLFRDIWLISGKCTLQNLEKCRCSRVSAPVWSSTWDSEGQSEVKPLQNRWLKSAQL